MKPLSWFVAVTALAAASLPAPAAHAGGSKTETEQDSATAKADEAKRDAEIRALAEQIRAAQAQMRDASRRLAELGAGSGRRGEERQHGFRWMYSFSDHAGLGVVVRTAPDGSPDTNGAPLVAVSPGGPAQQAGLKTGDVITEINGVSLAVTAPGARARVKTSDDDEDDSDAADASDEEVATSSAMLVREVRKLNDGDKVTVKYRRGKESLSATITARRLDPQPPMAITMTPDIPPDIRIEKLVLPDLPSFAPMALPGSWTQMELVSLNPDLGSYFSTDHGVLVVRAPSDAETGLRGGDVILKIGDEAPTTPANAIRMLRSSDSDEPVRLLVLRKGEKVTVATKSLMARRPLREAPPAPPTPPAAPRPRPGSKESL